MQAALVVMDHCPAVIRISITDHNVYLNSGITVCCSVCDISMLLFGVIIIATVK